MRRFQFPLDRVLRWRAEQASLEELKLQQARAEVERLAAQKHALEDEASLSARQVFSQPSIEPLQLTALESYGLHLRRKIFELANRQREAEAKVIEQRQRVLESPRQFELLNRLHNKAWVEWLAASNKEQEDLAAELYLAQSARKR